MRIALFEPDIPQNCGAIMRLCACMGCPLDLIEPFGFVWDEARVRRVAMDYLVHVALARHRSWDEFNNARLASGARLILLTTKAATSYMSVTYRPDDILLLGRESSGVPDVVHEVVDARVLIPMHGAARSMNVGMAASMVLGEALRQIHAHDAPIA
jgi:tRNA (cytidine/uridine-2'-O-)-methyltransferase